MLTFNIRYFALALILFAIEVFIELYFSKGFIRFYVGDYFVVILLYCLVKSFIVISVLKAAICVLLIAYAVETLQYLNLLEILGLKGNYWAGILLGSQFEWGDILAYTLGVLTVLAIEWLLMKKSTGPGPRKSSFTH